MQEESKGLVDLINSLWGGAVGVLIAAFVGRAMYHAQEVKAGRRKPLAWVLLWEIPTILGMGFIGEGIASYAGLGPQATIAVVAIASYYGPAGTQAIVERVFFRGAK